MPQDAQHISVPASVSDDRGGTVKQGSIRAVGVMGPAQEGGPVRAPNRASLRYAGPTMPRTTPSSTRSCGRSRSWSAVCGTRSGERLRIAAASSGAMTEK